MYNSLKKCKAIEGHIRKMTTGKKSTNHYTSLGITNNATQSDIKSAYYKLSMLYHPDKNQNSDEAATKFRDISEAYEVLGNVRSRKLYDKGLYIQNTPTYDDVPLSKFYKSRDVKHKQPSTTYTRTTVYDFDEWSRSHYGMAFRRDMYHKRKAQQTQMREQRDMEDIKSEKAIVLIGLLFFGVYFFFYKKDYDQPTEVTYLADTVLKKQHKPD